MNYTEKYHLPQWEETDRVMRTDFNQMCADMEAGLSASVNAASDAEARADKGVSDAAAAQSAAQTAQSAAAAAHSAANTAQAAADAAQVSANNAQATANAAYCPSYMPYAAGTYTGTVEALTVDVGFQPSFILIANANGHEQYVHSLAAGGGINSGWLEFTPTGFTVKPNIINSTTHIVESPSINYSGVLYIYIAFR